MVSAFDLNVISGVAVGVILGPALLAAGIALGFRMARSHGKHKRSEPDQVPQSNPLPRQSRKPLD